MTVVGFEFRDFSSIVGQDSNDWLQFLLLILSLCIHEFCESVVDCIFVLREILHDINPIRGLCISFDDAKLLTSISIASPNER